MTRCRDIDAFVAVAVAATVLLVGACSRASTGPSAPAVTVAGLSDGQSEAPEVGRPPSSPEESPAPTAMPVPGDLAIFHVVAARTAELRAALVQALDANDVQPLVGADALVTVVRRLDGDCTYVLGDEAQARLRRWIRAARSEGFTYGVVARWGQGAAVLAIEGMSFVGGCPRGGTVHVPDAAPDPDAVRPRRLGATGLVVDVPLRLQAVANGARFSFEDVGESMPIGIHPDPVDSGELERQATPGPGVRVETRELPTGARYVRRESGGRVSIHVSVGVNGQRWLCGCDEPLEAICASLRPGP